MAEAAWDNLVRGASLAFSLIIAFLFWWPRPQRWLTLCGTALTASTIAYSFLRFAPAAPLHFALIILAMTAPFWFWATVQILFEDRRRPPHAAWAVLAAIIALACAAQNAPPDLKLFLGTALRLIGAALVAHAGWCVWRGRRDDLVAGRLKLRTRLFVVLSLSVAGFVALAVLLPLVSAFTAGGIWPRLFVAAFQLAACYLLLKPDLALVPVAVPVAPSPEAKRLLALMAEEQVWKDPGLTVAGLAAKMALPEYRLRLLINETLGHRNFASFLNAYRLEAAAETLKSDPKRPVLTVALDNGFGSIGPFNRAFRERFGMVPSKWRRQAG
jgi:AraC-like DNA-binding protein